MNVLPGLPHPLGANWDGHGVNFALYSENAEQVELCLFDEEGRETRTRLTHQTAFVWHGYVPELGPGQRYGYRVHGPYEPQRGLRFNPEVVLLDPYAKCLESAERWDRGCFAYQLGKEDLVISHAPALGAPRGVVIDPHFDWEGDTPPRTPLHKTVIYEAHVRGISMRHPDVPEALRGTYAALAHPAIIKHLEKLGVTAIELMPIHAFVDDKHLLDKGLRNYWGYNSIGFFAPDVRYRSGDVGSGVLEFKRMVKALHAAGIEVILDVVYNHTAEGNHLGPTFCFKGIDNPVYYRLVEENQRYYFDYTGTGNTLNVRHPQVLALIMDSLRYWVEEMHIDGFRFDLASALARQLHEVDRLSSFFTLIHDSPALREVKMIAEPWDVGDGGYQVGNFPVRWAEWNGRYRDTVRSFWKGDAGRAADLGYRLTGSSDLYEASGRKPSASINFITAHDGFTLADLVSYNHKHNEGNGEGNRDGHDHEQSWNCGVEGPTEDPRILALRRQQQRNFLATLFLSQGTPMLAAGDEYGRSQGGNNNAYCQDNELSWLNWDWAPAEKELVEFTSRLLTIRRHHPGLHRSKFFQGRSILNSDIGDLLWARCDGQPMFEEDWENPETRCMCMFLAGRGLDDVDVNGRPIVDDDLLIAINASHLDVQLTVPNVQYVDEWELLLDTSDPRTQARLGREGTLTLPARSLMLFRSPSRAVRRGGALHTFGATYRMQLREGFGFKQAIEQIEYLRELGITDLYVSPIFAAARGSTHGYDVVDHERINPELGSMDELLMLSARLREQGMGLLVDWVPNHMGNAPGQNPWWEDVLEDGVSSMHAVAFDIEWAPVKQELHDTVLLPVLGDQYGRVLERGELEVRMDQGRAYVCYFDASFPLAVKSLHGLVMAAAANTGLAPLDPEQQELESLAASLLHLPNRHARGDAERQARAREKAVFKRRLARLLDSSPPIAEAFSLALSNLNGVPGNDESFDALDKLLGEQSYRLASWRVAAQEINYRRFFDINSLVALRMEEPIVFERAHRVLFQLLDQEVIQGLRLDHTDGLYDPFNYFESLQSRFRRHLPADPTRTPDDQARPLPILVEKILELDEKLATDWPVDGTTGYEFAALSIGVLVDPKAEAPLTQLYQDFTGDQRSFDVHVYQSKQRIVTEALASEVNMLARTLERVAGSNRRWRDFTLASLTRALIEILAAFPVYRTYSRPAGAASESDERVITLAVRLARLRASGIVDASVFDFIQQILLQRSADTDDERRFHEWIPLRFQQLTAPVMAKAVEDTAFYRYHRLIALNEVGGNPAVFGTSLERFHKDLVERLRTWPLSMLSTSTHDTKRGEDAAAAILVLTELCSEWRERATAWSALADKHKDGGDVPALTRADEYLYYQALVGAWPFGWDGEKALGDFIERMSGFMEKATKEAKQETSWTSPSSVYDAAVKRFVQATLNDPDFRREVGAFCARIGPYAATNALARTLLKVCAPGIPDTYQGAELWNQSLVDPDNRRPVDYGERRTLLARLEQADRGRLISDLLEQWTTGGIKLFVTQVALGVRKKFPELFLQGDYVPVAAGEHAIAFNRIKDRHFAFVCVPRLPFGLTEGRQRWPLGAVWGNQRVALPAGAYRNAFTDALMESDGNVRLAECFASFPLVLLLPEGGERKPPLSWR